jgi:very-short-patch-repair endonuclease
MKLHQTGPPKKYNLTEEQINEIIIKYSKGMYISEISREIKIPNWIITNILKLKGIEIKRRMSRSLIFLNCKVCGKRYSHYPSNKKKFCSSKCAYEFRYVKRYEKNCKFCNKSIFVTLSQDKKFCDRECQLGYFKKFGGWGKGLTKETDIRIKNMSLSLIGNIPHNYGKTMENYEPLRRAITKGAETKKRLIKEGKLHPSNNFKEYISKGGSHNRGKTMENYEPLRRSSKKLKGRIRTEEHKKNIGIASKERWKNEEFAKKMFKKFNVKPNKKELILFDIIKENNLPFNYVGDGQVIIGGKCPDFLSQNPKHIIELFGDYWHNKKGNVPYHQTEKGTTEHYNKYGYKTLIIWEHELDNKQDVLNKIKCFLNKEKL